MKQYLKKLILLPLFFVVLAWAPAPDLHQGENLSWRAPVVMAEDKVPDTKKTINDTLVKLLDYLVVVEKVLFAFLVPLIAFLGKLMSNDWVLGTEFGIQDTMQNLWMLIRNLVNLVFVLIIIMMAFYTLFGKAEDKAKGGAGIKNLIIAIVLVNFSFFFVKVAIDMGNLAASLAFSIPGEVGQVAVLDKTTSYNALGTYYPLTFYNDMTGREECALYKNYAINFEADMGKNGTQEVIYPIHVDDPNNVDVNKAERLVLGATTGSSIQKDCNVDLSNSFFGARSAMYAYAFNLLRLPQINGAVSANLTLDGATVSMALGVIMVILFGIVTFALFIAFAVRMVLLWVYIIASPVLIVVNVMKGTFDKALGKGKDFLGLNQFLALVFMPAAVGVVISVGYLMLSTVNSGLVNVGEATSLNLGVVSFHFKGAMLSGFPTVMHLILAFMAIAFLWGGVFTALSMNKITESTTKAIKKFGDDIGEFVVSAPKYIPFVPVGKGKSASFADLEALSRSANLNTIMQNEATDRARNLFPEFSKNASVSAFKDELENHFGTITENLNNAINSVSRLDPSALKIWKEEALRVFNAVDASKLSDDDKKKRTEIIDTLKAADTTVQLTEFKEKFLKTTNVVDKVEAGQNNVGFVYKGTKIGDGMQLKDDGKNVDDWKKILSDLYLKDKNMSWMTTDEKKKRIREMIEVLKGINQSLKTWGEQDIEKFTNDLESKASQTSQASTP